LIIRRVYAALILAFGLLNNIPSALGVYQEMLSRFTPDVANLQRLALIILIILLILLLLLSISILDVCLNNNPYDLRSLSIVIEKMVIVNYYYSLLPLLLLLLLLLLFRLIMASILRFIVKIFYFRGSLMLLNWDQHWRV